MITTLLFLITIFASNSKIQVVPNVDKVYGLQRSGDHLDLLLLGNDGKWGVVQSTDAKGVFDFPKPSINCSGDSCEVICIGASANKDSVELIRINFNPSKSTPFVERLKITSADRYIKAGMTGDIWLIHGAKLGAVFSGCYFGRNTSACYDRGLIRVSQGAFMGRDDTGARFIVTFSEGVAKYQIPDSLGARDVRDLVANEDSGVILTSKCVVSLPSLKSEECLEGDWRYAYGGINGTKLLALNLKRDSVALIDRQDKHKAYYNVPRPIVSAVYRNGVVGAISKDSVILISDERIVRKKNKCEEGEAIIRVNGIFGTIQCSSTGDYDIILLHKE